VVHREAVEEADPFNVNPFLIRLGKFVAGTALPALKKEIPEF